jgi:calcium/calmodulin-dependent protein kinase I
MGGSASKKTMPNSGDGPYAPSTKKFHRTYALSRELGHGAFSVVRLGVHKVTGDSTAVKILQTKKMGKDEMEALRQEIEILHELSHPHIIKIIEVFDESEMYLVTELVSGGELFDRIVSKTYYTEKEARDLIKIFLTTMKYLHDRNIVHRDIKPENLLLQSDDDDANIKLVSYMSDNLTHVVVGSPPRHALF